MESFCLKQEDHLEHIEKAFRNYKKAPKDRRTQSYIEARLEHLEKNYSIFCEQHAQIIAKVASEQKQELAYFTKEMYDTFEEIYFDYKVKLKEDLKQIEVEYVSTESKLPTAASCEVRLPQINLPSFSGSYDEWQVFYDLFLSIIHENKNLSSVQKLHYLKSSLSGEPAALLKNLSITEVNYAEAWKLLTKRYNNLRYNTNEIMKKLFTQRQLMSESATGLKSLLDTTTACLKSLSNLGIKVENWDIIINFIVISKLDQESRKQWEIHVSQLESDDLPSWLVLTKFLETRFRTLEMISPSKPQVMKPKSFHSTIEKNRETTKEQKSTCTMCSGPHMLYQCKQFSNQSPQERSEICKSKRLCFNCLAPNHPVRFCRQATSCRRCGKKHHSLLHMERPNESSNNQLKEHSSEVVTEKETKVSAHYAQNTERRVLLATALVTIESNNGSNQVVRALIDQGSEASFINEATVQALNLKREMINGLVSGVGDEKTRVRSMVTFTLKSRFNSYSTPINAFVLSTVTSFLPSNKTYITGWPDIEKLPLADPQFGVPSKVDVILGVDVLSEILLDGLKRHPSESSPIAQNTQLGWILSGKVQTAVNLVSLHLQVKEDQLLAKFWEIEHGPESIEKKMTKEEIKCEEFFEKTATRDDDGRFVVRLPFKEEYPQCYNGNDTMKIALQRFKSLERKFRGNPTLFQKYSEVIEDYIRQGHLVEVPNPDDNPNSIYLPHHAVIREDKETTKLRCVFDASCKGGSKVSLNECLMVGPKLQQDLRHILMRWRLNPFCIVADIVQMYRQICVHKDDTDNQRIMWRFKPNDPIQCYKLVRLTFGTSCAPYLAVKCLQQLASDEQLKYPVAAKICLHDFYMDDVLTGTESEEEAIEIYEQLNMLMSAGGFQLQKWCTNSEKLLNYIRTDERRLDQSFVFKEDSMLKVLGICWNKDTDCFEYTHLKSNKEPIITKRKVLSDIARLYDPLGWIAPVIVTAKIFMQKLWKSGLLWDDAIPEDLLKEWIEFENDLENVKKIKIPRWVQAKRNNKIELHSFADASQVAYAATVYIRVMEDTKTIYSHLVAARTRVTPVEKEISIPRLELCAALLAAQLLNEVSQILNVPKENLYAWSDSTVVLAWLRAEPCRWTTFVSNRVSEILTILDADQWKHVPTKLNPADLASRGLTAEKLYEHHLWWLGPGFLRDSKNYIPTNSEFVTMEELRPIKALKAIITPAEDFFWTKFSTLPRLLRVLSYCKRVSQWKLPQQSRSTGIITSIEMNKVLEFCIQQTQGLYFNEEIKQLKNSKQISKSSNLHTLCPILDENNILRVGGRIDQSKESFNKKHAMILPSNCHLTKLIIVESHLRTLHGGPLAMLSYLRSKYWILRAREQVKKIYRNCVTCIRYSQQRKYPFMGQLPAVRLKPDRAFRSTGVDFTGFINLRFSPGRGSKSYKGYICIFICMVTRAIHLEAVSDLTASGFLAAFRRFVSRRGHCQDIYSDNGTNFIGASKELKTIFKKAATQFPEEISSLLASEGTTWHFIPPQAPNFGGLWEAAVRSTKNHLKRVVGDSMLTFEELSTLLTQIEACLNSRPLSQLSDNIDDPLPLTPGHFLVGEPLMIIPDEDYTNIRMTGLQRWKLLQKMLNDFWKRWSNEYLVNLNQRFKWTLKREEPEIGDIVIIQDLNMPPAKWLLGSIVEKHPGKDGITRVVTLKTKNGLLKRACNKLCFLPKGDL